MTLSVEPAVNPISLEDLVLETVGVSRDEPRLFSVAASWLSIHHQLVNTRLLGKLLEAASEETSALAGALFDVAMTIGGPSATLRSTIEHCRSVSPKRVLFRQYAENRALSAYAREESLDLFSRWGFWHPEVSARTDAVRPIRWVLAHCPELRIRALLGAGLESEILRLVLEERRTAKDIERILPYSYPAIHEAVQKLEGRGFVRRETEGRRMPLTIPDDIRRWLGSYPTAA